MIVKKCFRNKIPLMAIDSTLICTDWPRLLARIKRNPSFLPELQPFGTKRPGLEMTGAVIVHSGHSFTGSYCLPALNFSDRIVPAIFVHQSVRKCNSKGPRTSHWGRIFSEVTFDNFGHSMAHSLFSTVNFSETLCSLCWF